VKYTGGITGNTVEIIDNPVETGRK